MEDKRIYTEDSFIRVAKRQGQDVNFVRHSVWKDIRKELMNNKAALICLVILAVIIAASLP